MPETLPIEQIEIRAASFSKQHVDDKSEESQARDFVRDFLKVFGQSENVGEFEKHVYTSQKELRKIDFYWKDHIAIEMKSRGKSLENAFSQLNGNMECLEQYDVPNLWMVSDFKFIHLYRRDTNQTVTFETTRLRKYIQYLLLLAGHRMDKEWKLAHKWLLPPYDPTTECVEKPPVDSDATDKMTELYLAMKSTNYKEHDTQIYLARLLFCFFADDTGIFPQDTFYHYVNDPTLGYKGLSGRLAELFEDLNKPVNERVTRQFVSNIVKRTDFRYINGKLFEEKLDIPSFDEKMFQTLRDCINFDWSKINPAIFGSLFQGIMNKEQRRESGSHYTSEDNILKLVNPLFMDGLRHEFEAAKNSPVKTALSTFHYNLANLKFLDPACGCGNFLIIAYRELRRLEHNVVREEFGHYKGADKTPLDLKTYLAVRVEQFHGIEIDSWPCQIAKTGMWLMDHLMNVEVSEEFGQPHARLPLAEGAKIVEGNALTMDWESVIPKSELSYILGNPPFAGARQMNAEQKCDMQHVFGDAKNVGNLDYVTAWYRKAVDYIADRPIRVAFVSTNSITQGEQVAVLWKPLVERGVHINFGVRTFKWSNEAKEKAAVHCVIVGFSKKRTEPSINPYLLEGSTVFIEGRSAPICEAPPINYGSFALDDGNYTISADEYNEIVRNEPNAKHFLRPFVGAQELIRNEERYCVWLLRANPSEVSQSRTIMKKVNKVREWRAKSTRKNTVSLAETPTLFAEIRQPETPYLAIPTVSSESRKYIPIAFFNSDTIASNQIYVVPSATLYHFGILTSCVHMAWVRIVCGRLKSDYRYSAKIVYNNFPWPDVTDKQKEAIETLAQGVLDARANYPNSSLAVLYDPNTMPPDLTKAHNKLDNAVMKAYCFAKEMTEPEIVAELMERYRLLVAAK